MVMILITIGVNAWVKFYRILKMVYVDQFLDYSNVLITSPALVECWSIQFLNRISRFTKLESSR